MTDTIEGITQRLHDIAFEIADYDDEQHSRDIEGCIKDLQELGPAVTWTVFSFNNTARCKRCDTNEALPLPMPIAALPYWAAYFNTKHRHCRETGLEDSNG